MPLIRIHSLDINGWMKWTTVYELYSNLAIDLLVFDELKLYKWKIKWYNSNWLCKGDQIGIEKD